MGEVETAAGKIPKVTTRLNNEDLKGTITVRLGFSRADYRVEPGLYGVGSPNAETPVLVSANYKLSFDFLREVLHERDAFILVLDTKGVNVWCAAGKGTFGTAELVSRVESTKLADVVSHRELIVPQLGAPGVAAHDVKRLTGFAVKYGPVRASDIPAYIDSGKVKTGEMRKVHFGLWDRLILVPVEINLGFWRVMKPVLLLLGSAGLYRWGFSLALVKDVGIVAALTLLIAFLVGTTLQAVLLPLLPGRSFSVRGMWLGLLMVLAAWQLGLTQHIALTGNWSTVLAWWLLVPVLVSFVAQQFTGCTTFTSLSGVEEEMKHALPVQGLCAVCGILAWVIGRFV